MKFNLEAAKRGRPPLYETHEELADKIAKYFDEGCKVTKVVNGVPTEVMAPTFSGLAHYLGYASLDGLYKQRGRDEYFLYTVKMAQRFIASTYETNLQTGEATTGSIFVLKCMDGWMEEKDKQALKAQKPEEKKHKFAITVG